MQDTNDDVPTGLDNDASQALPLGSIVPGSTASESEPRLDLSREMIADYPFNDSSADVILRSSDNVDFYMHKVILSFASGFFRDMFTLQQGFSTDISHPEPPVIVDVSENAQTLYPAFSWCYPVLHAEKITPLRILTILKVANKYDMPSVIRLMHLPCRQLLQSYSRRAVFGIACTYNIPDVAQEAADKVKQNYGRKDLWDDEWSSTLGYRIYDELMSEMRAASYLRLIRFIRDDEKPVDFSQPPHPSPVKPQPPNYCYPINYADADIVVRSRYGDALDFNVHQAILSFSSPVLKDKISSLRELRNVLHEDLPILELPESGAILSILLLLCYPSDNLDEVHLHIDDISNLMDAGARYAIKSVGLFCRKHLLGLESEDPFHAYSIAMKFGWTEEARHAAVSIARLSIEDQYHPTMETMNTKLYLPLLKFCHEYRKRLRLISEKTTPPVSTISKWPKGLTACDWMWKMKLNECDMRDVAWAVSTNIQSRGSFIYDQFDRLQQIHAKVVEELGQVCFVPPHEYLSRRVLTSHVSFS